MDRLTCKQLTTSRKFRYTYYTSDVTPQNKDKPALLFCHGFPDSSFLWNDVIVELFKRGVLPKYRIIVPDMLGYAGTSKPLDVQAYNYSGMADDLKEILDAEEARTVIPIGHDWGAVMAQRFYPFYPDMVAKLVLLNIAYHPPTKVGDPKFDLDDANAILEAAFGAPLWAYWEFFTAEDGPRLMRENLRRVYEAQHGDAENWNFRMFCVRGAWRSYVTGGESVPLKSYATEERWQRSFMDQFSRDGFEAPVQWYKAMTNNIQSAVETSIPLERHTINVPLLFVGCSQDANNRPDLIEIPRKAGLLPKVEIKLLNCGHWSPMEEPSAIGGFLDDFLD